MALPYRSSMTLPYRSGSKRIIIDADTGTDDAIALLMALGSRGQAALKLAGITTVGGNAPLARTTRNTLALLEYIGRTEVVVARGASRPFKGSFPYALTFHGPGGISVKLPNPKTTTGLNYAVEWMIETLSGPEPATIVALGPLTNVANLLRRYPEAAAGIQELVVMGGAVDVPGNITPYAEFNFYSDPQAAREVMMSDLPITLVDLAVCRQVVVRRGDLAEFSGSGRFGKLAGRLLKNWFDQHPDFETFDLCDPLAIAVAMDPSIITTASGMVEVEAQDPDTKGLTKFRSLEGKTKVARAVDTQRFFKAFYDTLA